MMHCPPTELLQELLADRLGGAEADTLETHVEACPACQEMLEQLTRVADLKHQEKTRGESGAEFLRRLEKEPPAAVPTGSIGDFDTRRPAAFTPLPEVPGYDMLEELGRGGMGVVYRALHLRLNRVVALKMILAGGHASDAQLVRFLGEAEAVAQLQHANIVQVFESGQHNGLPYFTLEYIAGGSLADKVRDTPLPAGEAVRIVEHVVHGVAYAHERGILHRDLKPENVLLAEDGTPKVSDFGLAKRVVDDGSPAKLTATGAILGTPSYMAPEQAAGKKEIGPAADVYALGAILYRLLTGRPPFQGATALDTLAQVVADEPVPPARLQPKLPRDLDTICVKCLQKEPRNRYGSALALAEDLRRFQAGEPIAARPVGAGERALKWVKRRPALAALFAVIALALVSVTALGVFLYRAEMQAELQAANDQATQDRLEADLERQKAAELKLKTDQAQREAAREREHGLTLKKMFERAEKGEAAAIDRGEDSRRGQYALQLSIVAATQLGDPAQGLVQLNDERYCPPDLRDFTWRLFHRLCRRDRLSLRGHDKDVWCVTYSADGKMLATAGADGTVRLWDPASGAELGTLSGNAVPIRAVAFSPDGKLLASGGDDKAVRLWDVAGKKERAVCHGHVGQVRSVAFSADGRELVSAGEDQKIIIWDTATAMRQTTIGGLVGAWQVVRVPGRRPLAWSSRFNRDDKVWELALKDLDSDKDTILLGHTAPVTSLAFDRDGKRLVSGGSHADHSVRLWDVASGRPLAVLQGHSMEVGAVAISGDTVASAAGMQPVLPTELRLWDLRSGLVRTVLRVPAEHVHTLAFSPDGAMLATASGRPLRGASQVILWNAAPEPERATLTIKGRRQISCLAVSPDSKTLATPGANHTIRLWDVAAGRERAILTGAKDDVKALFFTPDGEHLLAACGDAGILRWHVATGKMETILAEATNGLTCAPDGKTWASKAAWLRLWDSGTDAERWRCRPDPLPIYALAFSADSTILATAGTGRTIKLWDVATGKLLKTLEAAPQSQISAVAFAPRLPGGRHNGMLVSAGADRTVNVWDLTTGKIRLTLRGHPLGARCLAFSPDGQTLASGGQEGAVKLWDPITGVERASFQRHPAAVVWLAFTPNGETLATAGADAKVKLWDAPPLSKQK